MPMNEPTVLGLAGLAVGALSSIGTVAVKGLVDRRRNGGYRCPRHDDMEDKMDELTEKYHDVDKRLAVIGQDVKFLVKARKEDRENASNQ